MVNKRAKNDSKIRFKTEKSISRGYDDDVSRDTVCFFSPVSFYALDKMPPIDGCQSPSSVYSRVATTINPPEYVDLPRFERMIQITRIAGRVGKAAPSEKKNTQGFPRWTDSASDGMAFDPVFEVPSVRSLSESRVLRSRCTDGGTRFSSQIFCWR